MTASLDRRLGALDEAVELADGRLEPESVAAARAVVARAGQRLGLGVEATVAALAGPTGAGKSTLFNALAGAEVAVAGRRRPTTSTPAAVVWGDVGGDLLDWLEVPSRHRREGEDLDGLVLLDLPDFDSVELAHRLEVDRVIALADLMVWVVDPQKYADATLHDAYLRPLAAYGETMVVVLNQADLLAPAGLEAAHADLRRLLAADGLPRVPVLAVSARTGDGLAELRELLRERVSAREAALARLAADVTEQAAALAAQTGSAPSGRLTSGDRERLVAALADAAGVPAVVAAVGRAHRRRGALATGWPYLRWLRRLRPDPLRRLRLEDGGDERTATSLPPPTPVQQAQVASASRALAASAAGSLPTPWPALLRDAATAREDEVAAELDRAMASADLRMRRPWWWRLAGLAQAALALVALAGALWLVALAALGFLRIEDALPVPDVEGVPLPTALLVAGLVLGVVVALLAGRLNAWGARRRARAARRALAERVERVAAELVVAPVERELDARERLRAALEVAGRAEGGRRRLPERVRAAV
jgi:GTP-binding protein EngB required for normal cell division